MSLAVVSGATLSCPSGSATSQFIATSSPTTLIGGKPAGNMTDGSGGTNIPAFGMCSTLANPQVAAATAAALGVLTPQPCVPVTKAWTPSNPTVLCGGKPILTSDCTCMCAYGGSISIVDPGQYKIVI